MPTYIKPGFWYKTDNPNKTHGKGWLNLDLLSSNGSAPTGLEAINEGNGVGWRLINRDPNEHRNIGLNAVDFSNYEGTNPAITSVGAAGTDSVVFGKDNYTLTDASFVAGTENIIKEGTFSYGGQVFGLRNTVHEWGYMPFIAGYQNVIGTAGSTGGTNGIGWYSGALGAYNELPSARGTFALGTGLVASSPYTTLVGCANVDITAAIAEQNWAPNNSTLNPGFVVGIGDMQLGGDNPTFTRRNGFIVWRDGTAELPEATIAEIDSRGNKAVPTVEWVQTEIQSAGSVYTATINLPTVVEATSAGAGFFDVGKTYVVDLLEVGDDFSNIGYVAEGVEFVATGTTPTTWTNSSLVYNITDTNAAIEVTENANTLGETVTWSFDYNNGFVGTLSSAILLKTKHHLTINDIDAAYNSVPRQAYRIDDSTIGFKNISLGFWSLELKIYS